MSQALATKDVLVLAGGGVAGIAWETGVLLGLQDEAPDLVTALLSNSTTVIGTSAGASVAAAVTSGTPLESLFAAQVAETSAEVSVTFDMSEFAELMGRAMAGGPHSPEEQARRVAAEVRGVPTPSPRARQAVIEARLPVHSWPAKPVWITAVDAGTGELVVFTRDGFASLVDAVMASCAVPGIWPLVPIGDSLYMDGGARTLSNLGLAAGAERVLVLVPALETAPTAPVVQPAELAAVSPARVHIVFADEAFQAAAGPNPLDPDSRIPAAHAGRALGRKLASDVSAFWQTD